jgi:hypothetical protein
MATTVDKVGAIPGSLLVLMLAGAGKAICSDSICQRPHYSPRDMLEGRGLFKLIQSC